LKVVQLVVWKVVWKVALRAGDLDKWMDSAWAEVMAKEKE
jgi:hypothetical protein